ncbi:MAG: hypothetical protein K6C05_05245 [Anaerovibrio sp.]|uniref:hypothetical protein n=1 Tax=Anaerovibrio sp. TaxID=1872532 RepID=UPI0025F84671|nr:hypothetical protein [Anaerovibrio sp.]MCR5176237.1 hypothetical protein [Anaerovibrio sp.]
MNILVIQGDANKKYQGNNVSITGKMGKVEHDDIGMGVVTMQLGIKEGQVGLGFDEA